jgi:hypothetical protein
MPARDANPGLIPPARRHSRYSGDPRPNILLFGSAASNLERLPVRKNETLSGEDSVMATLKKWFGLGRVEDARHVLAPSTLQHDSRSGSPSGMPRAVDCKGDLARSGSHAWDAVRDQCAEVRLDWR